MERVRQIFTEDEAILTDDHFLYTSGLHGEAYVNKDAIMKHASTAFELCQMIAEMHQDKDVQVVVGAASGAVSLSWGTALALSQLTGRDILGVYADKRTKDGEETFAFLRGYERDIAGKRILVVEDILTTGGSVDKILQASQLLEPEKIVGIGALCNRGGIKSERFGGIPIKSLLELTMRTWKPDECPMCKTGVPINRNIGQGKKA